MLHYCRYVSGKRMEQIESKPDASLSGGRARPGATMLGAETDNARAYASLKQAVLSGGFKPGEVVTLRALAKRLEIGDTPVREAVKRLVHKHCGHDAVPGDLRVKVLTRIQEVRAMIEINESEITITESSITETSAELPAQ